MDDLDFEILTHLQEDGRRPFTEIAKKLEVTEGTVRNRVHKLTADGILQITGIVNAQKVGLDAPSLIAISVDPGRLDNVVEAISAFPEVTKVRLVAGDSDLLVEVLCRGRDHLTELITKRLHPVDGITHTHTIFVLHTYKVAEPNLDLVRPGVE